MLEMLGRVLLGRLLGVFDCMQLVTMREMGVMTSLSVITCFGMFRRFAMMLGRFFQMLRCFVVMMMNLVLVHAILLDSLPSGTHSRTSQAKQRTVSRS
jgi:hypothetical protein